MTTRRRPSIRPETVTSETVDELDRVAMVIMQLDMALALAREKGLLTVETHLEGALEEARRARQSLLN